MTSNRRTFAIISHPDAGKTTLTEKLLLQGGAIHLAGEVKARGAARRARSDWMKIEQQRGISVTSSVMTFQKDGIVFNLLDTPGHEDFSEDTYRTLTAVDSAIMVIDAAKGIEPQTRKLFEVCRMRSVPIITFVNKVDREGRSVFETLDEVADALALDVVPMSWPIGMGGVFQGVMNFADETIARPEGDSREFLGKREPAIDIPDDVAEEIELARAGYPEFDLEAYRHGDLTPVYFGSALKNFGVAELIDAIAKYAPPPRPQSSDIGTVDPERPDVTGFIFKVQANMDPQHRDRIAFMRMVSGTFRRGMKLTPSGLGKPIAIHSPILFFAQDREIADTAEAGDIIGIPNHGTLRVGDTLSEKNDLRFTGLPNFAPEILRRVVLKDPTKTKQLRKALDDLSEEGVIQVFYPEIGSQWIVGVVGQLQLDVLVSRLEAEYKVEAVLEPSPFDTARWLKGSEAALKSFADFNVSNLAKDRDGDPVFMARSAWDVGYQQERNPELTFSATKER
ncbi:bacterial peptide chain release factor 3 (bRF-3) [Novosphingobium aromaticivorans DSM 12444]|uniref:Peptide chain release factor 3 n=1 Tax=Novosphingobium aromaticivorans (strain ATCC 700278 / DSM 12444 / CCUG 56034 / CIP 105152 / NBRC 16084 / F199) TaxID=279238 RepID=Q2GAI6_NOVAD|nr:peptide chain release factor 3 [Novosphingobium aromaticivorans]ABD25137.1 bacterial peptide chain release factor 3 (bRF-3) [Novosphingobium aromaticivorans DSM 12444]SCX84652.1 bacterial peptide chain release factor 3 (bRF-3) [Novosphingobium aromaticivorans]